MKLLEVAMFLLYLVVGNGLVVVSIVARGTQNPLKNTNLPSTGMMGGQPIVFVIVT